MDSQAHRVLRLQVTSEFARKKKRLLVWTWAYHAVALAVAIPGAVMTFGANDLRTTVQGVALLVSADAALIVIKLWYWIVHGRLEILRELKRLELRWTLERRDAQPKQGGE